MRRFDGFSGASKAQRASSSLHLFFPFLEPPNVVGIFDRKRPQPIQKLGRLRFFRRSLQSRDHRFRNRFESILLERRGIGVGFGDFQELRYAAIQLLKCNLLHQWPKHGCNVGVLRRPLAPNVHARRIALPKRFDQYVGGMPLAPPTCDRRNVPFLRAVERRKVFQDIGRCRGRKGPQFGLGQPHLGPWNAGVRK